MTLRQAGEAGDVKKTGPTGDKIPPLETPDHTFPESIHTKTLQRDILSQGHAGLDPGTLDVRISTAAPVSEAPFREHVVQDRFSTPTTTVVSGVARNVRRPVLISLQTSPLRNDVS